MRAQPLGTHRVLLGAPGTSDARREAGDARSEGSPGCAHGRCSRKIGGVPRNARREAGDAIWEGSPESEAMTSESSARGCDGDGA